MTPNSGGKKMIHITLDCYWVCWTTNQWLIFLAKYQLIYRGHILFSVCTPGLLLLCFWLVQFLKNISRDIR